MRKFILIFLFCFHIISCKEKEKEKGKNEEVVKQTIILTLERSIPLSSVKGRIDHMSIDIEKQRLFITALGNNTLEVLDLNKGQRIHSVKDIGEPQGVVFIPEKNIFCVSSGESGNCDFYDAETFELLNKVKLGTDADNLRYDYDTKSVFVGYGDGAIAVIDEDKFSLKSKIVLSGHPESFQLDKSAGRIYVNVPDSKFIEIIDLSSNSVINKMSLKDTDANFPMEFDEVNHLLFVGCRKPAELVIYDTKSLNEITRFEIRRDVDDIFYDPNKQFIYLSCGEGYLQVFKQEKKDVYNLAEESRYT